MKIKNITIYTVRLMGSKQIVYCDDLDGVAGYVEQAVIGDKFVITIQEMTREAFDKLPEFEGW